MQYRMKWQFIDFTDFEIQDISSWPPIVKHFTLILMSVGVLAIGYIVDSTRQIADLNLARSEEQSLKKIFEAQYPLAASIKMHQNQMDELKLHVLTATEQFSKKAEVSDLLEQLTGKENESFFKQVKLLPEKHLHSYEVQAIEFMMVGQYDNLLHFLYKIAAFPKIMIVQDFVIRAKTQENYHSCLWINCTASVYYAPVL
jgi:Tfp pilus assembly protein PilO